MALSRGAQPQRPAPAALHRERPHARAEVGAGDPAREREHVQAVAALAQVYEPLLPALFRQRVGVRRQQRQQGARTSPAAAARRAARAASRSRPPASADWRPSFSPPRRRSYEALRHRSIQRPRGRRSERVRAPALNDRRRQQVGAEQELALRARRPRVGGVGQGEVADDRQPGALVGARRRGDVRDRAACAASRSGARSAARPGSRPGSGGRGRCGSCSRWPACASRRSRRRAEASARSARRWCASR